MHIQLTIQAHENEGRVQHIRFRKTVDAYHNREHIDRLREVLIVELDKVLAAYHDQLCSMTTP